MANAIEDALSRTSAEQRLKAQNVIDEARRNIKLVTMQDSITPVDADYIAKNAQTIEEAKRTIPFETMENVDTISPPLPTPTGNTNYQSNVVELHPDTHATIETIQQGEGNNYLYENAVDRAMTRQSQATLQLEQQQVIGR